LETEGVNLQNLLTLPSISLNIFRTNFYKYSDICKLSPKIDRHIRESYVGGLFMIFFSSSI